MMMFGKEELPRLRVTVVGGYGCDGTDEAYVPRSSPC